MTKKRGEDKNADMKRDTAERINAWFNNENLFWLMLIETLLMVYLSGRNLIWCGMNNEDESVHCDQDDGECWEEDAASLGGSD